MGRRKITEEAEQKSKEETEEDGTGVEIEEPESSPDRKQFPQRMPEPLVEDLDQWAERRGMSRNSAVNFIVREYLDDE